MPLTINLLHEQQLLRKQSKRDPLKLGFYALGAVAALFFLYYAYRYAATSSVRHDLQAKEAEWARQEPASKAATTRETELNGKLATSEAVSKRIEGRFYWAPLLDIVLKTVPANVQLVNFTGTNDGKGDKITLLFEGIVAGEVPRIAADQFRSQLNDRLAKQYQGVTSSFRGLDDTASAVNVGGRSLPTARFTIECSLAKPNATPAVTPAPARAKKS